MSNYPGQIVLSAEWYPQSAVQLTWPSANTDWADIIDEVETCYKQVAYEISKRQTLVLACENPSDVKKKLAHCNQQYLRFAATPVNDTWARDHGGITIFENGKPVVLDFTFNGWGLKFAANHDNQITRQLYENGIFESEVALRNMKQYVLEGGSIESDGIGTILTTEECLLNDNRNSWMDKPTIENLLLNAFGASRVLWLKNGFLAGDDTDSHIDTLARFCSDSSIAYVKCSDTSDEHFEVLEAMEHELKSFARPNGLPYELIPLPMAEPVYESGRRLPATYANFLIINGAVLVATYNGTKTDSVALGQIKKSIPRKGDNRY
ncbi:MAG: agmatine deiminase family protein [Cyclobacteriaceae bacterium]|nr:agmatine deiminase family protein [Cyclobacteriaceae bacterium]